MANSFTIDINLSGSATEVLDINLSGSPTEILDIDLSGNPTEALDLITLFDIGSGNWPVTDDGGNTICTMTFAIDLVYESDIALGKMIVASGADAGTFDIIDHNTVPLQVEATDFASTDTFNNSNCTLQSAVDGVGRELAPDSYWQTVRVVISGSSNNDGTYLLSTRPTFLTDAEFVAFDIVGTFPVNETDTGTATFTFPRWEGGIHQVVVGVGLGPSDLEDCNLSIPNLGTERQKLRTS